MLIGADKYDRALVLWDMLAELKALVEVGGQAQVEDVDQFVDRASGPGAAK
jgi:hypothetical protein